MSGNGHEKVSGAAYYISKCIYLFFSPAVQCGLWDLISPVKGLNPGHGSESRVLATGPPGNFQEMYMS